MNFGGIVLCLVYMRRIYFVSVNCLQLHNSGKMGNHEIQGADAFDDCLIKLVSFASIV